LAAVALLAAFASACAAAPIQVARGPEAKVERVDGTIQRVTLTAKSAERLGIETTPVRTAGGSRVIPYSALIYDNKGDTFAYTNPSSLVYVRHSVRVSGIRGNEVALADGPAPGAAVVTTGASQLYGIELGIGS
jgi:hypothetical protein